MAIKHTFVSNKVDSSDTSKIQPSHWNADHDISEFLVGNQDLIGTIDGTNNIFTLPVSPNPVSSLQLYKNGQLMKMDIAYTLVGNTITFNFLYVPKSNDVVWANYQI